MQDQHAESVTPDEESGRADQREGDRGDGVRRDDDRLTDPHLADVDDGCGCTEVWEHLSERRGDD